MKPIKYLLGLAALTTCLPFASLSQSTAFTYQGRLDYAGTPANGSYDFRFILYTSDIGGSQQGPVLTNAATAVSAGGFTVPLDFGSVFPGAARWLEMAVRTNGSGTFVPLNPRQLLTPTPYAITAANLNGTLPTSQLTGTLSASQLSGTYSAPLTFNNSGNSFTGNGAGLSGVNAATIGGFNVSQLVLQTGDTMTNYLTLNGGNYSRPLSVYGKQMGGGSAAIYGQMAGAAGFPASLGASAGIWGDSSNSVGVHASSFNDYGLKGATVKGDAAIVGMVPGNVSLGLNTGEQAGVLGIAAGTNSNIGVVGAANPGTGVRGTGNPGVYGLSYTTHGQGVVGECNSGSGAYGVWGKSTTGHAGYFTGKVFISGNLSVGGTLTKSAGSFKIDHPTDPANKYLYHSFVESPDMKNIYDGVVQLDAQGQATVPMPAWFEALNQDFRYQLTAIGAPAPQLHIAGEIKENQFQIAGGSPGGKVSWQVTGTRHDAYANAHRIPVEEAKPAAEQGTYLHPAEYGQPAAAAR